jgi:hypothetical protein
MMRVFVSVAVVAGLTAAYVVSPLGGWLALSTLTVLLLARRAARKVADAAEAETG